MARNPNQPTSFVNWQRYFSANEEEAREQAEKFRRAAEAKAKAAADARQKLQNQFNAQSGNSRPRPMSTNVGNVTQVQQPPGNPSFQAIPKDNRTPEELEAAAKDASYRGPSSLLDLGGSADAGKLAADAERDLKLLGSEAGLETLLEDQGAGPGDSRFSAALTGQAGARGFEALRRHFRPQEDLDKALKESEAAAKDAKARGERSQQLLKEAALRKRAQQEQEAAKKEDERRQAEDKAKKDAALAERNRARAENDYGSYQKQMNSGGSLWKSGNEFDVGEKAYMLMTIDEWEELMRLSREHNSRGYWGNLWGSTKIGGDPNDEFRAFVKAMRSKYG